MKIIRELQFERERRSGNYKVTTFKNEHGTFLYNEKDQDLHKWSDNKGWNFLGNYIRNINEACELTESMFGVSKEKTETKKPEEFSDFLIKNTSSLSDDEVLKIVNIIKNAVKEWRLLPGNYEEEKKELLEQLDGLKYCKNDSLTNFFNYSGKIFLRKMPEEIRNKLICIMAFKEAA